ncbi:sensor histidine kinase [Methylosinus sporium]|uniref:histidine kinase n=1 Tax=Methylosinus sporium TaxID=428 RepID=A0A2U1SM73_METSR|nr:sensor histidine kinase [Methylosinus sporium]PWB92717.1 sensor histidine kinase [Methylosinus sporium]
MSDVVGVSSAVEGKNRIAELEAELASVRAELCAQRDRYRELRHRVRNDLQALATLISAQSRRLEKPEGCSNCAMRLRSAVELHNALDEDNDADICMSSYLWALSEARRKAFDDRIVGETIADDDIFLHYRRAQCVGLVYVEAVANAMKHAFPDGAHGEVQARLSRIGDRLELTVADNGCGFDPAKVAKGDGLQLMRGLARQLKGQVFFERLPQGALVRLDFPEYVAA